jgi:hypothetical protein
MSVSKKYITLSFSGDVNDNPMNNDNIVSEFIGIESLDLTAEEIERLRTATAIRFKCQGRNSFRFQMMTSELQQEYIDVIKNGARDRFDDYYENIMGIHFD